MIKRSIIVLVSLWLGWTALIDFAVVPTVFSTIKDFFNAGELGIALFSKLNSLELVISSALIVLSVFKLKKQQTGKWQLTFLVLAWCIVLTYFSWLTPKITELTKLWKEADAINQTSIAGIADIQQEHQHYHRIYVTLDTIKILILATVLSLEFFKQEKVVA